MHRRSPTIQASSRPAYKRGEGGGGGGRGEVHAAAGLEQRHASDADCDGGLRVPISTSQEQSERCSVVCLGEGCACIHLFVCFVSFRCFVHLHGCEVEEERAAGDAARSRPFDGHLQAAEQDKRPHLRDLSDSHQDCRLIGQCLVHHALNTKQRCGMRN